MKRILACLSFLTALLSWQSFAAPATLLFEDDFNRGIPGWTAIQPPGTYIDGPMRWQYDIVSGAYVENSNIYTDNAAASPSGTAVMLINDAVTTTPFTYKARLTLGDDDGFGLVFGYENPTNVFRLTFSSQNNPIRTGYPWRGWGVDQKTNNVMVFLFGGGTAGYDTAAPSFLPVANRPFDVTISVSADNKLTLSVIDDALNNTTPVVLVDNQQLPDSAAGKVGLLQWGDAGGTPRAFRIQNPTLEPTPLVVPQQNQLTNWTSVNTLRADGVTGIGNLPGTWSLALGVNGPLGVLLENSDIAPGNDAAGQIDFPTPALVAGENTWSNYVVRARMFSNDDDGYGLMLRYVDETNFYRVAWRSQNSATGVRRGLSVQKAVNGVFEEIFFEATPQYLFPGNAPFEVSAAIITNSLQVLVRGNLNTTPTTFIYGPFDMAGTSGETIPAGKPGIFSWAMNRLEVDWFRVYAVDGVPIEVSSQFGPANPPVGLNSYPPGTTIEASVPAIVDDAPGRRRRALGFTGFGSVPTSGTGNIVSFTLNAISSITWDWATEYRLNVTAGSGGTVSAPAGEWQPAGSTALVTATPNAGFVFTGWTGSSAAVNPALTLLMAQPFTLTANFKADSDGDGLPDEWETTHFAGLTEPAAGDPDSDGVSNAAEFQRGSNPKFAETEVLANPFGSRWENVQRDPALPGVLIVRDFGAGFRGVWENSNDYREADTDPFLPVEQRVANVSFEGPRMIITSNAWNVGWSNFVGSAIFSVGDNDGNCVYFRYQSESNWYRVTVNGSDAYATWRAPEGISVQKRVNGIFTQIAGPDPALRADPTDALSFKRFRVTVVATNADFEVRVAGWNTHVEPAVWDPDVVLQFNDPDLTNGRFGVGLWGQGGSITGGGAQPTNPVDNGALIEDVTIEVAGAKVLEETWDTIPLPNELPSGWSDPVNAGIWNSSAHGSIIQLSAYGPATTATTITPRADAESANLIGPSVAVSQYLLEVTLHPFDSDGIGFIYDYVDTNNYSRVLFVSASSADGRAPQGLNVSRKVSGVWSDIIAGDLAFVYTPGQPFNVQFAKNAQEYRLNAKNVDNASGATWTWPASAGAANTTFGLASWAQVDAHYHSLRVLSLTGSANELSIGSVSISGGNLVLSITNPGGGGVNVQSSSTLAPNSWTTIAQNVTTPTWSVPLNTAPGQTFYRLSK